MHGGYPQGSQWFAWNIPFTILTNTPLEHLNKWLVKIGKKGHAEDIQSVFALPYQAIDINDVDSTSHLVANNNSGRIAEIKTFQKSRFNTFNDIQIKNNKLFCYPYNFLRVSNNQGSYNDYKIEEFHDVNIDDEPTDTISFNIVGVPCIGFAGQLVPRYYEGFQTNIDESLQLGKYPTLSWSTDSFTNWLTQNAVNMSVGLLTNVLGSSISIGTGIATGNPLAIASGTISVATGAANSIGSLYKASLLPNTAQGNANAGDIGFAFNINRFKFAHMRCKKEYLEILDDYFTRFGYKINKLENPNINGRRYWNYVEIGKSEEIGHGDIPSKYMEQINNAFRQGVTIWHNHENIGNYNLNNTII